MKAIIIILFCFTSFTIKAQTRAELAAQIKVLQINFKVLQDSLIALKKYVNTPDTTIFETTPPAAAVRVTQETRNRVRIKF